MSSSLSIGAAVLLIVGSVLPAATEGSAGSSPDAFHLGLNGGLSAAGFFAVAIGIALLALAFGVVRAPGIRARLGAVLVLLSAASAALTISLYHSARDLSGASGKLGGVGPAFWLLFMSSLLTLAAGVNTVTEDREPGTG